MRVASKPERDLMQTKSSLNDLAIFGGTPSFSGKLHVGRPNIGDRRAFARRVNDILDRRWLTNGGRYVQEFEEKIAEIAGVRHCVAMCNATIALEIAIRALNMTGEVIVPSFTFIASAHALQWQGVTPVFCDIDPRTHNIDPGKIEELITPRTTGILGVHVWGRASGAEVLGGLAEHHNLRLLFDAAHAFGCTHQGAPIGRFGNAEVFSFHGTKFFNTFEGGAVVTNDDELAEKMRLMKNFGFAGYDQVIYIGTNGKMSEVAAAMGITNLESMPEFMEINRLNYDVYRERLLDLPGIRFTTYDGPDTYNYQYIVLEVDDTQAGITRDELLKVLWAENVLARRYFYPGCHKAEPYRSLCPNAGERLPVTETLCERVLTLPTGTSVGAREIDGICQIIAFTLAHSAEISERLNVCAEV